MMGYRAQSEAIVEAATAWRERDWGNWSVEERAVYQSTDEAH